MTDLLYLAADTLPIWRDAAVMLLAIVVLRGWTLAAPAVTERPCDTPACNCGGTHPAPAVTETDPIDAYLASPEAVEQWQW